MDTHRKYFAVIPVMVFCLLLLPVSTVAEGWSEPLMISDSVQVVGSPEVMNNFVPDADTSWVVWRGQTTDTITDIFLTKLWSQYQSVESRTMQLSQSTGQAYSPTLVSLEYGGLASEQTPVIAWLHTRENADSVDILWRRQCSGGWTDTDTLATTPLIPWIHLYPGLGIWAAEELVLYYPGTDFQYLYQLRFDTDNTATLETDTITIEQAGLPADSLQDFHVATFFDHDMFTNNVIARIKSGDAWYIANSPVYLANPESWPLIGTRDEISALDVAQGHREYPAMGWIEQNDSTDVLGLLESRSHHPYTLPTFYTDWKEEPSLFPMGDNADMGRISIRNIDTTRTLLTWDAVVDNNREIFFRATPSDSAGVQLTGNPGSDANPAITHLPAQGDSLQPVILWVSDRTGTPQLWGATSKIPVKIADEPHVPMEFRISQNYPNPFNAETTIEYQVPQPGNVSIEIFNLRGQRILSEQRSVPAPRKYAFHWNSTDFQGNAVSSGVYLIRVGFESSGQNLQAERIVRAVVIK
ncbi:MAG: hypothetical protein MAGBODY4_01326 [Candidatus Marinimicrobia bacterium]|nr:hypothetical protein [Candidatus Neomarinimicrobiota bacterium]